MLSDELVATLRCPQDRSELKRAPPALVSAINQQIDLRQVSNRTGRTLERHMDEGLIRADGDILYPVVDGIPRLLIEEGILLAQYDKSPSRTGNPS